MPTYAKIHNFTERLFAAFFDMCATAYFHLVELYTGIEQQNCLASTTVKFDGGAWVASGTTFNGITFQESGSLPQLAISKLYLKVHKTRKAMTAKP